MKIRSIITSMALLFAVVSLTSMDTAEKVSNRTGINDMKVTKISLSHVEFKFTSNPFIPVSMVTDPCDGEPAGHCNCVTSVTNDDCVGGSQLQQTRTACSHAVGYPTVPWEVFYVEYTWLQMSC